MASEIKHQCLFAMPSRQFDGYKFQFYSADSQEPPHIHVVRAEKRAKIWLEELVVAWSRNFNQRELAQVLAVVQDNQTELIEWYNGFFR
jgi:hypothetical protein